jgi:hypothetical protein
MINAANDNRSIPALASAAAICSAGAAAWAAVGALMVESATSVAMVSLCGALGTALWLDFIRGAR